MAGYDELKSTVAALSRPSPASISSRTPRARSSTSARPARLRDRVRSYFLPEPDIKVRNILRETADIDYILTGSEKEAAFLENNFVQQDQPKFNLRLKDDKSFPYLKLTPRRDLPRRLLQPQGRAGRLALFRAVQPGRRARKTIHLVNKYFGVRSCEEAVFRGRKRPCLEYDLRLCSAPCVGHRHRGRVPGARRGRLPLSRGPDGRAGPEPQARHGASAAADERFEEAARWRDLLRTLEDIRDRPQAISVRLEDQDVVGFARSGDRGAVYVFFMRKGKIRNSAARGSRRPDAGVGRRPRSWDAFLADSTRPASRRPGSSCPSRRRRTTGLEALLGGPTRRVVVPHGGKNRKLVEMAGRNAEAVLRKQAAGTPGPLEDAAARPRARPPRRSDRRLRHLQHRRRGIGGLAGRLPRRPARQGRLPEVQDQDRRGLERRGQSRQRSSAAGTAACSRTKAPLPDLVMVDGGKPQLGAAREGPGRARSRPAPAGLPGQEGRDPVHARASRRHPARTDLRPPSSSSSTSATRPTASPSPSTAAAGRRRASRRSSTASRASARRRTRPFSPATAASRDPERAPGRARQAGGDVRWPRRVLDRLEATRSEGPPGQVASRSCEPEGGPQANRTSGPASGSVRDPLRRTMSRTIRAQGQGDRDAQAQPTGRPTSSRSPSTG